MSDTPPLNPPRTVIIVQARMGSSRLPGKALKEALEKPLLGYLVDRLRLVNAADDIIIATTTDAKDQVIVDFCQSEKVPIFRGSENNVLDRFYHAALAFQADTVVRITADCPLIDPVLIDEAIQFYHEKRPQHDYVSNAYVRSFPLGMDVEVFSFKSLAQAAEEANLEEEKEHVTPFIYRRPHRYNVGIISHEPNLSHYRLTVDTEEDFQLVKKLIEYIYPTNPDFTMDDILVVLRRHPDWLQINAGIKQREINRKTDT